MKPFLRTGILIFVGVCAATWLLKGVLAGWNVAVAPVMYGNAWLFAVTFLAFYFELKGVRHSNAFVFFRYVYAGMLLKLFLSIGAVLLYALEDRSIITRGVGLIWLALYCAYTGLEVSRLIQAGKVKQ
jgi:hypothetical protein